MAFPQIRADGYRTGAETSNSTSHSVSLPTTELEVDDLILVFFACDGSETLTIDTGISGSNWNIAAGYDSGYHTVGVYWKIAEGEGYDYLTINTTSEMASYISYAIYDYRSGDPLDISTYASGSSTNMNPPALTPSYGSLDYLWIVIGFCDALPYATAAPTDFSDLLYAYGGSLYSTTCSSATREYNTGSSYDPGTFTSSTADWISYTIVINPLPSLGIGINGFAYNY